MIVGHTDTMSIYGNSTKPVSTKVRKALFCPIDIIIVSETTQ